MPGREEKTLPLGCRQPPVTSLPPSPRLQSLFPPLNSSGDSRTTSQNCLTNNGFIFAGLYTSIGLVRPVLRSSCAMARTTWVSPSPESWRDAEGSMRAWQRCPENLGAMKMGVKEDFLEQPHSLEGTRRPGKDTHGPGRNHGTDNINICVSTCFVPEVKHSITSLSPASS